MSTCTFISFRRRRGRTKGKNQETVRLAEAIRAKRVVELQNGEYGFSTKFAEDTRFFDYFRDLCEKRFGEDSRGNWGNWRSCLKHLEKYERDKNITFRDITPEWVQGFREYLERDATAWGSDFRKRIKDHPLARNSKLSYFNKLRACLNQAYEDGIIRFNPIRGVQGFKPEEGHRMYLTIDEVRRLADTDCEYPRIKDAFLFSCLTGLRRSDIVRMTWGEVQEQNGFTRIIFRQKKTGGQEYLDITPQAARLMGKRRSPGDLVFEDIHTPDSTNETIRRWVLRAGIRKDITFHMSRHTNATLILASGTDIYTVCKMLTHRNVTTTQIYTEVMDKGKREVAERLKINIKQTAKSNIDSNWSPRTPPKKSVDICNRNHTT